MSDTLTDEAMDTVCDKAVDCLISFLNIAGDPRNDEIRLAMNAAILFLVGSLAVPDNADMTNDDVIKAGKGLLDAYAKRKKEEASG